MPELEVNVDKQPFCRYHNENEPVLMQPHPKFPSNLLMCTESTCAKVRVPTSDDVIWLSPSDQPA